MIGIARCKNCSCILGSSIINSATKPCPACGIRACCYEITISDNVTLHDLINAKTKRGGCVIHELRSGDSLTTKTDKWNKYERIIDHINDWYEELITDSETGNIIHECKERLSSHRLHGSAKFQGFDKNKVT